MLASLFKDLHRLEIKIIQEREWEELSQEEKASGWADTPPTWLATWFVYDDKKCDHGHLHKQYKTKKNKDLIKLLEEIKNELHDKSDKSTDGFQDQSTA